MQHQRNLSVCGIVPFVRMYTLSAARYKITADGRMKMSIFFTAYLVFGLFATVYATFATTTDDAQLYTPYVWVSGVLAPIARVLASCVVALLSHPNVAPFLRWQLRPAEKSLRVRLCRFLTPMIGIQMGFDAIALVWLARTAYLTISTFKKKKVRGSKTFVVDPAVAECCVVCGYR